MALAPRRTARRWRSSMLTLVAFLFAIGVLVTVHEYGHYRAAVLAGVKVLRFSIGFGAPLLQWRRGETEFVVALIPLGGYVRMLDEREGRVPMADWDRAFNRKPVGWRALIVAAGPAANLVLAAVLFAAVAMIGVREPMAILGAPDPGTLAAGAGVRGGDRVLTLRRDGRATSVASWETLAPLLRDAAQAGAPVWLDVARADGGTGALRIDFAAKLPAGPMVGAAAGRDPLAAAGLRLQGPPARVSEVLPSGAAAQAGLRAGDLVLAVDGRPVRDITDLLRAIQSSGGAPMRFTDLRGTSTMDVVVKARAGDAKTPRWHIGAMLGGEVPSVLVRSSPLAALGQGVSRTWSLADLTLRTLGRMVIGQAPLSELSGPVSIADYAGRSAALGWSSYLGFLAMISVSLGVLNLLPLPVLDGGHLLYYAVEALTRRSIPQRVQERLQQGGLVVIALMMVVALYNDFARLLGPFH